jgi:tetratricopeptide (TPR) repeat protein
MAPPSVPAGKSRTWLLVILVLVLAVASLAGALWKFWPRPYDAVSVAVMQANNRGVGHMERFKFPEAVAQFEEVTRLAPNWLPGRINLGIALMNLGRGLEGSEKTRTNDRALQAFSDVLKRDPNNPYAHYCRGLMIYWEGNSNAFPQAETDFAAVTRIGENDAFAWHMLGRMREEDPEKAIPCFERALRLDPHLNAARFSLHSLLRRVGRNEEAQATLDEFQAMTSADWATPVNEKYYTDRGRYARVIGAPEGGPTPPTGPVPLFVRNDKLQVQLAPGARWATAADFGTGPVADLRAQVRKRFGAVMVALDYNRDGLTDLFLVGAVVEGGRVRDLLLRNDGGGRFTDVTAAAGLGGFRPSLGCCVADFDNDSYPDLFITGAGQQHLFRNNQKGGFVDVTAKAGLDKLKTVCLGAAFVDLDQDGDLDLIVAQYADTPEHASALLKGEPTAGAGGLAVYLNVGTAPVTNRSADPPPLEPAFRRADGPPGLIGESVPAVNLAATDLDLRQDLDLFVLADGKAPAMVLNDRLLRFHRAAVPEALAPAARWNGALVLDTNHQERSDLFLLGPGRSPMLLAHLPVAGETDPGKWFEPQATNAPPLLQAQAIDIDLDSWTDVVGLSEQHKPVLLHNDGHRLAHLPEALGRDPDWPSDLVAVVVADFDCHGLPDLMVWSEANGLQLHVNQGNGNHGMELEITGHRRVEAASGSQERTNADGFGTRVTAQAGELRTDVEFTTLSAGLGQSRLPIFLGLGRYREPDVIRLRWPDLSGQAEFSATPSPGCNQLRVIEETNRKQDSCPILFAWDGRRFGFVTDFLGAGSVGEWQPDGTCRPPRAEESVKIEAHQLVPRDGQYVLKIAEPMDEVTYLDRLQLVVLDHPTDVRVYADERFTDGPPPSQDLLALRGEVYPVRARDHRGRDVTATLRHWDRDTVSDFARRSWLGFAEDHWVELDFGDRLAKFGPKDRLILCLAGWTDYPYPESIWAAHQAGVELQAPLLERLGRDGVWRAVCEAGFPAGMPRMMTLDVTGKLTGPSCVVRLRTNMQVFWDQAFVAPCVETVATDGKKPGTVRATTLAVAKATLSARGMMQEFSPDGRQPTIYDYDRLEAVPVSRLAGKLTRFGDVTELLRGLDDQFVLFGPGDDLDVRFDARGLPELPAGWTRSFVLGTWGYCKDCAPFTATGATIEPLPFRAMGNYPYGPEKKYPHPEYQRRYNTRPVGRTR